VSVSKCAGCGTEYFEPVRECDWGCGPLTKKEGAMRNIKPRNDFVAVKRDKPQVMSPGGIALPNIAADIGEAPEQGTVLAVGPKVTEVKVGDRVLIGSFAGWTFKVDGEPVVLVREGHQHEGNHILGVVT
jgi:chaperonin GroES